MVMKLFAKVKDRIDMYRQRLDERKENYKKQFGEKTSDDEKFEPPKPANKSMERFYRNVGSLVFLGGLTFGWGFSDNLNTSAEYVAGMFAGKQVVEAKEGQDEEHRLDAAARTIDEAVGAAEKTNSVGLDDLKTAYKGMDTEQKKEMIKYILENK
ncbi:hypothetical protein KY312_04010 [Candidatus Woesearchaeota archaeon]|nr:hypothetical protein [Candidatus Woesearchaeota archaeon]